MREENEHTIDHQRLRWPASTSSGVHRKTKDEVRMAPSETTRERLEEPHLLRCQTDDDDDNEQGRRRKMQIGPIRRTFTQTSLLTALCLLLISSLEADNSDRAPWLRPAQAQTSLLTSIYLPSASSSSPAAQPAAAATTSSSQQKPTTSALNRRDLSASFNNNPSLLASPIDFHPNARGAKRHQSASNASPRDPVCQVNDGESVAIVEIVESRGSDLSQPTNPVELPISGSVQRGEIELRIESETHKYFQIQDKRLRLTRPLDRDGTLKENSSQLFQQQPISSIYLQISCLDKRQPADQQVSEAAKKVIIPVLVKVLDLNDNAPKFSAPTYNVQVNELTPLDSIIFDQIQAIDLDSANNGNIEYSLLWTPPEKETTSTGRPQRLLQRDRPEGSTTEPAITSTRWEEPRTTTSAATLLRSSSQSSINLNSEPIMNGPMEDGEDEESDEALLASMLNSTLSDGEAELAGQTKQMGGRRRRRHSGPLQRASQEARIGLATTTRSDLWTDLMAAGNAADEFGSDQQQAGSLSRESLEYFALEKATVGPNGTSKPVIKLKRLLDYETRRVHVLTVLATDRAGEKSSGRLSSSATLIVRVLDGDDQGPAFVLDQGGCATGTLPQPTPASARLVGSSGPGELRRRLLGGESLQVEESSAAGKLPSGFKITDENFDFGDSSAGDEQPFEATGDTTADGILIVPEGQSVNGSPVLAAQRVTQKARPEPTLATQAPSSTPRALRGLSVADYSCLTSGQSGSGQAEYFGTVMSGESDYLLRIAPQAIRARDRDELNAPIRYSFVNGTPSNYSTFFQINPIEASVKQIAPIETSSLQKAPLKFVIWVQAEEQTTNKLASLAKLTIEVVASDKTPPVLVPNSYGGFVEENAPIGSNVLISHQQVSVNLSTPMRIQVISSEGEPAGARSSPAYEFETTSDAFKVNKDGFVYVNKWPLDRDPPSQPVHMFQVTARQVGLASSRSLSSPVSINVTLLDLNDNPPVLVNSSLERAQILATNQAAGRQQVTRIKALDLDSAEHARVRFSLRHVSNGGRDRFRVDEESGELEAIGRFQAGEQFSLTLQAADELGRSSQGILELVVAPGPNTGGPQFIVTPASTSDGSSAEAAANLQLDNSRGYSVEVSEGVAPHTPILQVRASDPENDPISYSIVDGNINNDFYINTKTGQIYTNNRMDREEIGAYRLLVQARDSGGLATNRPVHIAVSDINDSNPQFERQNYVFQLEEGTCSGSPLVGRVQAHDPDAADNGRLSYQLVAGGEQQSGQLFSVDERSGEIRCLEPLDFERAKSHRLLVMAKDAGEQPRSSTCSVLVRVLDVQDEAPYFERYFIETRVPENAADFRLGQVQAIDPDSVAQVTYTLKSGDASLFAVDPQTGVISTRRGLDFEEARQHTLLVGTLEHQESDDLAEVARLLAGSLGHHVALDRSPICRVDLQVVDTNDETPQFVNGQPLPVRVQDSAPLGTQVTRLQAEDKDASEPNNQIRYELLSTPDPCSQAFLVDANSGQVSVKWDLRRMSSSECQLQVAARDLGQPNSLSSQVTLTVFIDHIAEVSPAAQLGFADTHFTVELEENAPPNTLVKLIPVLNKPKGFNYPMSCEIVSGQESLGNKFYVIENEQRDCELRTSLAGSAYQQHAATSAIDYEQRQRYALTLRLNSVGSANQKSLCQVQVNILDKNDNRPQFQQPARYSHLTQGRFLAAIANDAPGETQVIQVRAQDADSSPFNGLISYELLNGDELDGRFKIEPIDGIVRTSRPVEDIPHTRLPMRLKVMARDHPELASESLESVAEIVINLIDDRHRIALVLKDTPTGRVLDAREELLSAIQERTGMISGLEKVEALKVQRNGTIESDVSGSDLWFYLIEPGTLRIVPSEDPRLRGALFEQRAQSSLLDVISQSLGFNKVRVRLPFASLSASGRTAGSSAVSQFRALTAADNLASFLIVGGLCIGLVSAIVLIYQCGSWSSQARAVKEKFHLQQQILGYPAGCGGLASDSYAPFHSAFSTLAQPHSLAGCKTDDALYQLEPSIVANTNSTFLGNKQQEYETQMLKMSVLFDDSNSVDEQHLQENQVNSRTFS